MISDHWFLSINPLFFKRGELFSIEGIRNYVTRLKKYRYIYDAVMSIRLLTKGCFRKGGETRFVVEKSAAVRFATLFSSPSLESRQLVEGIVARVHPRRVSTCVSAEFRRIDTFPETRLAAKLLERIARGGDDVRAFTLW